MGESSTIQISSGLVNKLVSDGDKLKKKAKKSKPKIPEEPRKSQNKAKPAFLAPKSGFNGGWPLQSPMFLPMAPPPPPVAIAELEAVRSVLQESEGVMDRLEKQEANVVHELTKRAKELHDKEFKLSHQKSMPCLSEREACLECYKEQQHSKDPLKCAQVVRAFADCAREVRQQQQVSSAV